MKPPWFSLALFLLVIPSVASSASDLPRAKMQIFTLQGEMVHNVGAVWLNITNFGLLGSQPGSSAPYASAPSLQYPVPAEIQNLFSAGIWIGGVVDGVPHVSTGQYAYEIQPDPDDLSDRVYRSKEGMPNGLRMPGVADDDGDGLVDEDPLNGYDDDGDGLIDEDFAAIGQQYFHAQMRDDRPLAIDTYPDHSPMGLLIEQESFAWEDSRINELIGLRYRVRNVGQTMVNDVFVGLFADFDIGGTADDDLVDVFSSHMLSELSSDSVQVDLSYAFDASQLNPYAGLVLLNHQTPEGEKLSGSHAVRFFRGELPYDQGGDATNDAQRYESLSNSGWPIPPDETSIGDYRVLSSAGPFGDLAPGQELVFEFVFVMGGNLPELAANAANAVALARGRGVEYQGQLVQVPWLLPQEQSELDVTATLKGHWSSAGAFLKARLSDDVPVRLVRRAQSSLPRRVWKLDDARRNGPWLRYRDTEEGPWPRKYVLKTLSSAGSDVLARLTIDRPFDRKGKVWGGHGLRLFPNPFNPRTELQFTLDRPGRIEVEVFDLKGRRVRRLASGDFGAGDHRVLWDGLDDAGRALSSGLYFVRLSTPAAVSTARALLVR